ncbi:MAG: ribosome biogenesis GTPase YlqF [Christensenellales bacterium]|jgi:ribosome biogenesis GTPase A
MQIQWYPGHMAKTRRLMREDLKLVDVVVEVLDARIPRASRNPDFDDLFGAKKRVRVLNKADLADPASLKAWCDAYRQEGIGAVSLSANRSGAAKQAVAAISQAAQEAVARAKARGMRKIVRAMVVGIPNVGKSTLTNCIAGGARAKTGDRPGVTRSKQWIRVNDYLELMDTPGMLWPKLEDPVDARHMAYVGTIRDEIMDQEQLAALLLADLCRSHPGAVSGRYGIAEDVREEPMALLEAVCRRRGMLLPGSAADLARGARTVLDEFRGGKLGRITLEQPGGEDDLDRAGASAPDGADAD